MKIYLDIDGVLLNDGLDNHGTPANYAVELLEYLTSHHDVYWLTTHCMNGANQATALVSAKIPDAKDFIIKIKPTNWSNWKTEGIDFSQDFRWLDDDVYKPERDELAKQNCTDKLIEVNLRNNPNQLKEIREYLRGA